MRATSPGGDASYEGQVLWSNELGYGDQPAEAAQSAEIAAPVLTKAQAKAALKAAGQTAAAQHSGGGH
jgi:hypothetical protein